MRCDKNQSMQHFSDDDFASDDDYPVVRVQKKNFKHVDNEESDDDEEEQENIDQEDVEEDEDEEELDEEEEHKELEEQEEEIIDEDKITNISQVASKLKKLTPEQLAKEQKRLKRTGVCYLSTIPPYMKPSKLRSILSRFGKIDRLFLKPEDHALYKKRVKYGGNKKKNYVEGWVEYLNKKDAKLCCSTMNGNIIGGKKTSFYYDDILNIKYLHNFKWFDLTQQISKENEIRQAKLTLELSQQQKMNKSFINNVDQSKLIKNIENTKRKRNPEADVEQKKFKRNFQQRDVTSKRSDAEKKFKRDEPNEKLNGVLSKIF